MSASTSELIVSVSGIRGIVGEGLTSGPALAFAQALGTYLQGGKVVLSRDSRPSGAMLRHAVIAGLTSAGCEVHDLAITPTPTVGLAIRNLNAAGGIQISASHNPSPWNGLKLFGSDGGVLSAARGKEIKDLYDRSAFRHAAWDKLGELTECRTAEDWHRERVLQLVDIVRIRSQKFRVLLDANAGTGGPLGKAVLDALGCESTILGGKPDGDFQHPPEPLAENLTTVLPAVRESQSSIGFVLDPDADRLALLDEQGRYIGEELTLALGVLHRLKQQKGDVVINMSTSRVVEDLCRRAGVKCHRAAVGEANVVEKMREVNAVIGGEGNGGVIDPRVGWVRDPFIGMGLILDLMAEEQKPLSEIVASLPSYVIVKDKYQISRDKLPQANALLEKRWPNVRTNKIDGLRLDWDDRWVHVRPSNTEPIVRVIAEAPTEQQAQALCKEVGAVVMGA
ncbi:MAG: phosphoglucosamine mutase [Gemmataceae bacterium]|nr:phosphoglucosamine mutase [Gemmataceae bacterium]